MSFFKLAAVVGIFAGGLAVGLGVSNRPSKNATPDAAPSTPRPTFTQPHATSLGIDTRTAPPTPQVVLFLVDVSGSMKTLVEGATPKGKLPNWNDSTKTRAHAAYKLAEKRLAELQAARPDLEVGLCLFDEKLREICEVRSGVERVRREFPIIETNRYGGGTDLYGRAPLSPNTEPVIVQAARYLAKDRRNNQETRLLLVITDEWVDFPSFENKDHIREELSNLNVNVEVNKVN